MRRGTRRPWAAAALLGAALAYWAHFLIGTGLPADWLFFAAGKSGLQVGQECAAFNMGDVRGPGYGGSHCYI
jgi:hypothetical protein